MKKSIFLALTAILALSFVACGKDNGGNTTSSADSSSTEISTPVEDSSVEDSSVEDSSVEDSSVEDSSVEDSSVEDSSVEDSSVEDSSVEDSSVEDSSVEDSSVEDSSVEDSSVEDSSVEDSSVEDSSSEEDGGEEDADDETAPVFSEIDATVFEGLKVGDSIKIPAVTATDDTDGEVEVYASFGNRMFQNPIMMGEEIVFEMDGTYVLKYVAQDAAGNVAEMTISIVVAVLPSVAAVLPIATANNDATSGTIVATNNGWVTTTEYELADGYAHLVKYSDDNTSRVDNWIMAYGEDKVLFLVDDNDDFGVYKSYYETVAGMENGYAFETIFDYTNTYYGVEEFVAAIYSLSEEKVESWANGVYSFSLVYINENNTKYEVSVDFTVDGNSMMDKVDIAIDSYYAEADGSYLEEPDAVRTFEITQNSGDEVVVAYDPAEVLVSSYTIKDAEGAEVSALDLVAGEQIALTMADINEGATAKWDTFNVTVVDSEGIEVYDDVLSVSVSTYYDPVIYVTGYAAGEYTITIESGFVTKTLTATVVLPETTEIYAKANKWAWSALTEAEIYADGALNFVIVVNDYADASAAMNITACPDGAEAYIEDNSDGSWTFYPDENYAGEYEITIVSLANEELSSTITVTVNECPDLATICNGEYQNSDKAKDKQLYVMMMEVDDKIGQIFVALDKTEYGWDGSVVGMIHEYCLYDYEYDVDSRTFMLTAVSEEDMIDMGVNEMYPGYTYSDAVLTSMTLTAEYQLKVVYANDMTTLVPYAELTAAQWVAGDYACAIDEENRLALRVWDDGTASLTKDVWNPMWYGWSSESGVEFRFTVDSSYVMTVSELGWGEMGDFAVGTTLAYDAAANTITVTIDGTEYVFA